MSQTVRARIGFLGSSETSSPHHKSFQALIPNDIDMTFEMLEAPGTSLYDAQGKLDSLVNKTAELQGKYKWDGIIVSGAPKEALNPGLFDRLSSSLEIPVTTALRASIAALRAFSAKWILLMTPVDDNLKQKYKEFLRQAGIDAVYPLQALRNYRDAVNLTSSDVDSMTRTSFAEQADVDAIYFQGALLDPLRVLQKLERDLNVPIVASNPAMLWSILSKLGLRYQIAGYGKLLSLWPNLPA